MADASWSSKVASEVVHAFGSDEGDTVSALVEIDVPRPRIAFDGDPRRGEALRPHFEAIEVPEPAADSIFAVAGEAIGKIIERPPHPLRASAAFVVNATRKELERIAALDCVKQIRLNRRLR